ncbi:TorF family putative porin [Rubritalea marina]|uniref:TorF family putative porin n=1 Tax=Rubritalea marina TaxID=361055 RepID=UPI00036174E4|nr:TorF family putative porin [Rubritalea marina]
MNNKITLSLLGGALVSGSAFAGEVVAPVAECDTPCFEGNIYAGYHSDYIWRGTKQGQPLIDAGVDLSKSAWGLDFAGGAWLGSFKEQSGKDQTQELDLYAEVSKDFGFVNFTTGYIYYQIDTNASSEGDAKEVYFALSKDLAYGLSTSLTHYWNVTGNPDKFDNNGYSELSASKSDLFLENLGLGVDFGFLTEGWEAHHVTTTLGYDYAISENATLSPYLAYTFELDAGDTTFSVSDQEQNRFHGGVALSVSF